MSLYAEVTARRRRQALFDVLVILWIVVWGLVGWVVHRQAVDSASGARRLQEGGTGVATSLSDAGESLSTIPLIGDTAKKPFDEAADAGRQISDAGQSIVDGLDALGALLGTLTAALPIAMAVLIWAYVRMRYARAASRAVTHRERPGGAQILALQALVLGATGIEEALATDRPGADHGFHVLGDSATVRRLADARLGALGLHPLPPSS
ncbi:hypothetical protein [Janibacter alittae]|uniref:Transmembrane protein n=1 Tax=Janibacter alittae TaxID=3115209 RepID=A0ABZ2MH35_9MICO